MFRSKIQIFFSVGGRTWEMHFITKSMPPALTQPTFSSEHEAWLQKLQAPWLRSGETTGHEVVTFRDTKRNNGGTVSLTWELNSPA